MFPKSAVVGGRLGETPLPPRGKSNAPNQVCPVETPMSWQNAQNCAMENFGKSHADVVFTAASQRRLGTTFARRGAGQGVFNRVERVDRVEEFWRNDAGGRMRVYDEPVGNADKSWARRKASRPRHFAEVAPSRLRRRRKYKQE